MEQQNCPRCEAKLDRLLEAQRGSRKYLYAIHYDKAGGKIITRQCYLGPREYLEVAKLHPGLKFREHWIQLGRDGICCSCWIE